MTILNEINTIVRQLREITGTKVIVLVNDDLGRYELKIKDVRVYATDNPKNLYRLLISISLLVNDAKIKLIETILQKEIG